MSASTSPQPHFVLALESVICWTLHGWLCKPGGALLLHKAETKDDRTPTGSSVVVENMRAHLSLVTLKPSAVPRTTRTQRNTQGELVDIRGWYSTLWLRGARHKPKLIKYQKGLLASFICWYCELASLFIKLNNFTHRFYWVSSLFQRDICFLIDSATP